MKRLAAALEIASGVFVGAITAAAYAGPLRFHVLGATLTIRTLSRPLVVAGLILAVRLWLLRGPSFAHAAIGAVSRVLLAGLVAAGVMGWLTFLSTTCGGSDSYGYVSAADRLLSGTIVQDEPLARLLPFPDAIVAACPLGYVPAGRIANASAPMYPLGLPALMATARVVFGRTGPFGVAPVMGLLLLVFGYLIARAWYADAETALLAAALLALNPLVFAYTIQPMSDIPAAAAITAAVAALSSRAPWPFLAGTASAAAILIRPALAPVALMLAAVPMVISGWRSGTEVARYLIPVAAAVVGQGWTQWYLYGDALSSGYGSIVSLFSPTIVATNLRSYGYWGFFALGPVWMGAVVLGLVVGRRTTRLITLLVVASVAVPYLFYRPYDHWETLRFLLPAIVLATIVAAAGLLAVARLIAGHSVGVAVAAIVSVFAASSWMSWLSVNQVFTMPEHEARHRLAGELVAEVTPHNSVVFALQHSGSLRYYAERHTVNWDRIPTGALVASVRALQEHGLTVYLMIDSEAERAMLEARHGAIVRNDRWLPSGQRRDVQLYEAPMYAR